MNSNIKKWDQIYRDQKWDIEFAERDIQDFCRYHLPSKPKNFKMLDVGCGHGVHALYLKKKGFKIYGIDTSLTALNLAKKRLGIKKKGILKKCSFEKIDFPDEYFDAIISKGVLYFGSYNQLKNGVEEIYRLLKPNSLARIALRTKRDYLYNNIKDLKKNSKVVTAGLERGIVITFLDKKQVKQVFKTFKKTIIGLEEHNYINLNRMHSYWIITAQK